LNGSIKFEDQVAEDLLGELQASVEIDRLLRA